MKKHIPNLITCCNVLCGTLSIFFALKDYWLLAAWLVVLAMVFDFFDGFAARLLHVRSELGKELDSLADVVSFGVVPALLAHFLIARVSEEGESREFILSCFPVLIAAFSAYRLAKFNLDTRQTYSFIGVPTPANALFWVCLVFSYYYQQSWFTSCWGNPWLLVVCVLCFSWLLISEIPMFSLKFTSFAWSANRVRYLYFVTLLLTVIVLGGKILSFIIPLYILFNLVDYLYSRLKPDQNEQNRNREKR